MGSGRGSPRGDHALSPSIRWLQAAPPTSVMHRPSLAMATGFGAPGPVLSRDQLDEPLDGAKRFAIPMHRARELKNKSCCMKDGENGLQMG